MTHIATNINWTQNTERSRQTHTGSVNGLFLIVRPGQLNTATELRHLHCMVFCTTVTVGHHVQGAGWI